MPRTKKAPQKIVSKRSPNAKKTAKSTEEKKTTKHRKEISFLGPIYKILKQVHPNTGITDSSKNILNDMTKWLADTISDKALKMAVHRGVTTIALKDVLAAIRLTLPGELAKYAVSESNKAATKYVTSKGRKDKDGNTIVADMGLTMPYSYGKRYLRGELVVGKKEGAFRIGEGAPPALLATLEYLIAEVLELSGNAAIDNNRVRIIPRYIMLAIHNDVELGKLYSNFTIENGGVIPNIHTSLLPKKQKEALDAQMESFVY